MTQAPPPVASTVVAAPAPRPGGLTALAVLNFVFAAVMAILSIFALIGALFVSAASSSGGSSFLRSAVANDANATEALNNMDAAMKTGGGVAAGIIIAGALIGFLIVVLLVISAIGYLKMKKSGYTMGMVYAIVGLILAVLNLAGGAAGIVGFILWGAYPVITLILLNTTFKKCFR